ncbi:flavin-containing monooxygenase [Pseudonocardia sp. RS010]|uniref:flavin-containing monooxygenase n=1 Tax=Pseudonocardia sp. RS010 TaxID=3385979 RepID=UPI0039A09995
MTRPGHQRCAVIGAGAAGVSAARHLLADGHEVVVYEAGSYVGGLWVHGNDNGLSVAYTSLHINSEASATAYDGFPFPADAPLFPAHGDVRSYLEAAAEHFGVRERIRFRTPVNAVEPAAGGGWTVRTEDGAEERYDVVVVASGHQGRPAHPAWAGEFTGRYLHSNSYRDPEPFTGERVLVVGVGNSGLDVAADLVPFAASTLSSARSPVLIMPRMILGVPSARVLAKINRPWLPWVVQRQVMRWVSRIFHGRPEQWGFRTPKTRTHPASNATYMAHVSYGRIDVRPGIEGVDGRTVRFADGSTAEVDTIIAATGYEIDLPFLQKADSPVVDRRIEAYKRVVHPDRPGLYFVGFFNVSGGANIAMMDVQSRLVAAAVSGDVTLPDPAAMHADIDREQRFLQRHYPSAARYGLELDPVRYRRQMAELLEGKARS